MQTNWTISVSDCARAHIAAALQLYLTVDELPFEIQQIATQGERFNPLDADEIIALAYHFGHDIINPRDKDAL